MQPLTITACLGTPPIVDRPIYFDAILYGGIGARMGRTAPSGWAAQEDVDAQDLPLGRVTRGDGMSGMWWWAASHVICWGPQSAGALNRTPVFDEAEIWTSARTLNHGSGPDRRLRLPFYMRPGMMELRWTCFGAIDEVIDILGCVPSIGKLTGHGHGWVERWKVELGGPTLLDYANDVALRHIPQALNPVLDVPVMHRNIPLRPPYHRREDNVPCWQAR